MYSGDEFYPDEITSGDWMADEWLAHTVMEEDDDD